MLYIQLQEGTIMSSHCTPQNDQEKESLQKKMSQCTVLMQQFLTQVFLYCDCRVKQSKWIVWKKKTYQITSVFWFFSYSRRIKEVRLEVKSPVGFSEPCFFKNWKKNLNALLCLQQILAAWSINISNNLTAEMKFVSNQALTSLQHRFRE